MVQRGTFHEDRGLEKDEGEAVSHFDDLHWVNDKFMYQNRMFNLQGCVKYPCFLLPGEGSVSTSESDQGCESGGCLSGHGLNPYTPECPGATVAAPFQSVDRVKGRLRFGYDFETVGHLMLNDQDGSRPVSHLKL